METKRPIIVCVVQAATMWRQIWQNVSFLQAEMDDISSTNKHQGKKTSSTWSLASQAACLLSLAKVRAQNDYF